MSDAFKKILKDGMILKNFDATQRRLVRTIDGGYDPGDTVFVITLIADLKIHAAGLPSAFNTHHRIKDQAIFGCSIYRADQTRYIR